MLFVSLVLSSILLTVVIWSAWYRKEAVVTALIGGCLFSFAPMCLMFYLPVVVAHSVAVVIVASIWQLAGWRFRYLLVALFVATLTPYGIVGAIAFYEVRGMLQEYPYESMEARLPAPRRDFTDMPHGDLSLDILDLEKEAARSRPHQVRR